MSHHDHVESDTSSKRSGSDNVADTKNFPLATVDEPVLYHVSKDRETAFDVGSFEEFYKPIETYEGVHRYDPDFQWDEREEKRLVRKVCLISWYESDDADNNARSTYAFVLGFV